jgi:hypothetical protein
MSNITTSVSPGRPTEWKLHLKYLDIDWNISLSCGFTLNFVRECGLYLFGSGLEKVTDFLKDVDYERQGIKYLSSGQPMCDMCW